MNDIIILHDSECEINTIWSILEEFTHRMLEILENVEQSDERWFNYEGITENNNRRSQ